MLSFSMILRRSLSGDALAETDGSGSTTNAAYTEYVFFAGRRIASRVGPSNGNSAIFYYFADQLGSTRTITTGSGSGQTPGQLCYDQDYTPYGQEVFTTSQMTRLQTTACAPNYKFTGYERDPETGLDYAFARYYSSRLGRFLSTDPLGGSIGNLQSWNRYAYVGNNPLSRIDPKGLYYYDCVWSGGCSGLGGPGGGVGAGYYGGGPGGCSLDGVQTACGNLTGLGSNGIAACPGPCTSVNGAGQIVQFHAFAGLAEAVNGYYAVSGVGSLSYTVDQAGIEAAQWGAWYGSQTGSEVGGSLWCGYGVCSSTLQQLGQPGAGSVFLDLGFSDIPDGTDPAGWWRAQSSEYSPNSDISTINSQNAQFGTSFSLYSGDWGDPGFPVIIYNQGFNSGYECVLAGPVPSSGILGGCPPR